jgi:AcrR family transcriptional regulator
MDAAERVFAAKGYEAASVMDLAKEAGFTKGALYAHFSSKEELFLAVITRGNEMGVAMQDVDPEASPEDLNTPIIPSEDDLSSIMLSLEAYLYALRHPEARETMRPLAEASITSLAAQVAFWRSGEKREPTDQELTMAMGLASLNTLGGIMNPILGPDWKLPERAETLAETIIGSGE